MPRFFKRLAIRGHCFWRGYHRPFRFQVGENALWERRCFDCGVVCGYENAFADNGAFVTREGWAETVIQERYAEAAVLLRPAASGVATPPALLLRPTEHQAEIEQ